MIGQLRTPIGVYRAEEIADGRGGFETRWVFHSRLWAHVEPRITREPVSYTHLTLPTKA